MSVEQLERYLADMLEEQETRWGYKTDSTPASSTRTEKWRC